MGLPQQPIRHNLDNVICMTTSENKAAFDIIFLNLIFGQNVDNEYHVATILDKFGHKSPKN